MKWQKALDLLHDCEEGLRKLGAEAFAEGDYLSVNRIRDAATLVASLAGDTPTSPAPSPATQKTSAPKTQPHAGKPQKRTDVYPKFFRRGDELVKVGWSKKERKEYNHRAPRAAVDATAAVVGRVGANGRLFNGDALLPLKNTNGETIPDYQVYVALAWFKELDVIEQRGIRAGYTTRPTPLSPAINSAWATLDEWRG